MFRRLFALGVIGVSLSIALIAGACSGGASGASSNDGGEASSLVVITARNLAFDKRTITLPANTDVTIRFVNNDIGQLHNVGIYTDSSLRSPIFVGELFVGNKTVEYKFKTPGPGTYFFHCDAHPEMKGEVVVK